MRAILLIYLINEHNMSERYVYIDYVNDVVSSVLHYPFNSSSALFIYHSFVSLAYFSPLFGSIAADNFFGRFEVIRLVSVIYVLGHVLLSVGAIPQLAYGVRTVFDFAGLVVIALATGRTSPVFLPAFIIFPITGGIKPCVAAFAADQVPCVSSKTPATFTFSLMKIKTTNEHNFSHLYEKVFEKPYNYVLFILVQFYFSINAGSLIAIFLTPILRGRISCLGSEYCFPLAFGL
jgi:solute carrier family 15 oligopeptide transporter 1